MVWPFKSRAWSIHRRSCGTWPALRPIRIRPAGCLRSPRFSRAPAAQTRQAALAWSGRRPHGALPHGVLLERLRDWVHRFNAEGIEGLKDRPRAGRKPLLDEGQLLELDQLVETPPDPVKDGVVRWRCCDLKIQIKNRFDVEISERSVGRILRARKFCRLSPRPKHPKADEAFQQTSRTIFPGSYGKACLSTPRPSPSKSGSRMKPALARKAR
jgi:transposase